MKPERLQEIERVFHVALERPESLRAAFLEEACAGDRALREEVESLLAHEGAESFIETSAMEVAARALAQDDSEFSRIQDGERQRIGVGAILANRYKVLRCIGKGGMGEVFEAEDRELHERIALKTILPEIGSQEQSIQQLKREIQLARKVTHPNVCRIFDLVYHGTTICLTMELLEGETLAQRLQRTGPMTTGEAFPLVSQMAAALAAAHKAGIVHRDFKCGNVMLVRAEEEGGVRAVIMDFGLARRNTTGDASAALTATTGAIRGTPAYVAPEQVEGSTITSAADIYALGVVMFEMVTGRCPFEGDTPLSVAVKRLQEPPPSPRSYNPGLDSRWEKAILCCLERNPRDRFASAEEMIKAIQPHAPPVEPAEQPRMLEAAAPKRAAVGRSMQLLAMIRRPQSDGLKAYLEVEEPSPLTKEDIRAKPFRLEFPLDRIGAVQSAEIVLKLDSPDFEPKSQSKKLMVPPERDSEVCTFLLTPKLRGELLLNLEVLKGDVLVASRAIKTVAEITEQQLAFGQNVLVSIPLEVIAYGLRAPMSDEALQKIQVLNARTLEAAATPPSLPPPSPRAEPSPSRSAPVSDAAKSMKMVEELRRSLQSPRPPDALSPARPTAPAPPPPVAEPPKVQPAVAAQGAALLLGSSVKEQAPAKQKALEVPPPRPPAGAKPSAAAGKASPKMSPSVMAAVMMLVVILGIGGYMIFDHHQPTVVVKNMPVGASSTQQQEKDLFAQAKAAQDAKKWDDAISLYNNVADLNGPMKDQALQSIPIIKQLQVGADLSKIERATFQQASSALQKKDWLKAQSLFQEVIDLKVPDSTLAPEARYQLAKVGPILQAKAEFDAAAGAQNRGDLQGALVKFQAIAAKPGTYQAEAKLRIPELTGMMSSASANAAIKGEFDSAVQAENNNDLNGALDKFKVIAGQGGTFGSEAQKHVQAINAKLNAAAAKKTFDAAVQAENGGRLDDALSQFSALLANADFKDQAQAHVQEIKEKQSAVADLQKFDDAVKMQNRGDLQGALTAFKALAAKPGAKQAEALDRVFAVTALTAQLKVPPPVPTNPAPPATTTAARNPVVTPLVAGAGDLRPLTRSYSKRMMVPDYNVDGGVKAISISMPRVAGAPAGSLVVIKVTIDENGNVTQTQILNDTNGFGSEVEKAAHSWKFKPPTAKGKPVTTNIMVKVTF